MGKEGSHRLSLTKRQKPPQPHNLSINGESPHIQSFSNSVPSMGQHDSPKVQTSNVNILKFPYIRTRNTITKKTADVTTSNSVTRKVKRRRNSETSSDEERWLNAIETGKLDDVDEEMKKMKDPKLMTARQRAMYDTDTNGFVEELISLPSGYKEKEKPQTAEEIHRAVLKSQKRKQQADERREKDKKKTMERLLKKQESNKQRLLTRNKHSQKSSYPKITYISAINGNYIVVPPGHEFFLKAQIPLTPPRSQLCSVSGCGNRKAYNCSTTKLPLCSLTCYRKNISHSFNQ
ncbi:INO80 complex subunit B isoform X1 [Drosophila elegans]|uniref:INO80 complex subunit B isoform X1 n=1 Tax=Drosophila elegans TaxID=30023 RepID=UPI0007E6C214|nr:INO80 complex subunit B isoform X1 [Drosophila elegans]